MISITQIKARLARKFRGTTLDDIEGLSDYTLFEEAASNILANIDPFETVRRQRINVFDDVYDYPAPSYLKGKKLLDPRPEDGRMGEDFYQTFQKDFDRDKAFLREKASVEYVNGVKVLRLASKGKASMKLDDTSVLTDWAVGDDAESLSLDHAIRFDGSDTIGLSLDYNGGTGYLENDNIGPHDLTEFIGPTLALTEQYYASFFRYVYLPAVPAGFQIALRLGNSDSVYIALTTGVPQLGQWIPGKNLVRFDPSTSVTGVLDLSDITYERVILSATADAEGIRVGPLFARLPRPYEVVVYSDQVFQDPDTNELHTRINDATAADKDTVRVVLERDAENIFFYECCVLIAEDLTLDDEAEKFRRKLYGKPGNDDDGGLYGQYRRDKPSEPMRVQTRWLTFRGRKRPPSVE